jgi:hypothetical protein
MDRADEGGGGPFAYYPVTGDAIREAATETDRHAIQIRAIRSQLDGAHRRMMGAVTGDIEGPMNHAPAAATANMVQVVQASAFAAGVMRLFADAVDQFNHTSATPRSVDKLNTAYTEARLDSFGLDLDSYDTDGPSADRDFDADWREAHAALIGPTGTLTVEYARLEEQLDIWADHAARMLRRGPTPDDVRELWSLGTLPPDAASLWPGRHLNQAPVLRLPYELRDEVDDRSLAELSDDELMRLWEEHGYEPAGELLGDRVAYDVENMTALAELNLNMNPLYWKALSDGLTEDTARQIAKANPASFIEIVAPYVIAGEFLYGLTARDLVDALREDPMSLRSLGEIAMATPVGRLGKLAKIDNAVDTIDDLRDAERAADAATSAIASSRTLRGRFPRAAHDGEILVRRGPDGRITNYQVYGSDGLPLKRVDLTGRSHAGVATPHVVEFERHVNPATGEVFLRPDKVARPATPEELMGLE